MSIIEEMILAALAALTTSIFGFIVMALIIVWCAKSALKWVDLYVDKKIKKTIKDATKKIFLAEEIASQYSMLGKLQDRYFIDDKKCDFCEKYQDGIDCDIISVEQDLTDLKNYNENPEIYFRKKFYDPLDNSTLVDPVTLIINHRKIRFLMIKVNRENAEKYIKFGPNVFPVRSSNESNNCLIKSKNKGLKNLYRDHSDQEDHDNFDIISCYDFHKIIGCEADEGVVVDDIGFTAKQSEKLGSSAYYYKAEKI